MKYLLILLLLASCATAKKKAIELSEKGRHEEAIEFWAEALKKDPDDEEVQNGFQASLDIVSNDRLTRIRDKRLANNLQEALVEMKSLVDLQKKWNIKLDFNSSSFQGKEVNYLWPYYKSTIVAKLNKKMPLGAESDHKTYQDVFNSVKEYDVVQDQINHKGKEKCHDLKSLGNSRPFFGSYVSQFCRYFKAEGHAKNLVSTVLYGKADLTQKIQNINETTAGGLFTSFEKSLTETPWYHPEAKNQLKISLDGDYVWKPTSEKIQQAHNYNERVPYTDYVNVKRTRSVPYTDYVNGSSVVRYKNENYYDKEPVTKYRDVPRVYEYWATKKTMEVTLNLKGSTTLMKESHPYFFQKTTKEEKILHDISLPSIGLEPKKQDVKDPLSVFDGFALEASTQFKTDMTSLWEKSFCTLPGSRDLAGVGENVIRCKRLQKYPEVFVDTWFMNNFGVTGFRATELLGQF